MKAQCLIILAVFSLAIAPVRAQDQGDAVSATQYEATGNFVYATKSFSIQPCGSRGCNPDVVVVTARCPNGYVALGTGWTNVQEGQQVPLPLVATLPTKRHDGWVFTITKPNGQWPYTGSLIVTCAFALNALYRH
jgi:hypothetical protein